MKKIPAYCFADHKINFNLGICLYQNIITFLEENNILFLSNMKLNFDLIPLELHGKGNSSNLLEYLSKNDNENIYKFINYFLFDIIKIDTYNSDIFFEIKMKSDWQNINITVFEKYITTIAPTTTTTTIAAIYNTMLTVGTPYTSVYGYVFFSNVTVGELNPNCSNIIQLTWTQILTTGTIILRSLIHYSSGLLVRIDNIEYLLCFLYEETLDGINYVYSLDNVSNPFPNVGETCAVIIYESVCTTTTTTVVPT